MHAARVLCDSVSPQGVRLTTLEVVMPRIVLAEFNTHRMFSRNSASSRAIPVEKMIRMVLDNPYIPLSWGKNQRGMQADEDIDAEASGYARGVWLHARDAAVVQAERLLAIGVHKQLTNRLLEPFMWHTVIVTATEWDNFFHLRDNPDAHPDIQLVARRMREAMVASTPQELGAGEWHLPLVDPIMENVDSDRGEAAWAYWRKVSVARCARVSYLTHDGKRDPEADLGLYDRLLAPGHMSPFEHVARPMEKADLALEVIEDLGPLAHVALSRTFSGNFRGWVQYRKTIAGEADILGARKAGGLALER